MEQERKDWLQNTCVPDMAFVMELGDKSSGNMTLLQAGSTAVPGNLPATHLSVFIFLQGGWPWALYLGQTNWLQGKTWPWSLWERWAKEHPLKHLDSWHAASHINHTRGKKSQLQWEIYQDAHVGFSWSLRQQRSVSQDPEVPQQLLLGLLPPKRYQWG